MKDKVILVCEALRNRAGIERMTVELANLLSDRYAVEIVTIDPFSSDACPFDVKKNVKVVSLESEFKKSIRNFNRPIIKKLREIFIKEHPKAIITVATPLVRLTAPACKGLNIRNISWEHFNIYAGSKMGTLFKVISPWFVDTTVALTEADGHDYRKWFAPRIKVIPNFTSIGVNEPSKCENKVVLAVGRHAPQKGFDLLIKAWAKTNAPDWMLRIVGSGEDKSKNEKLAKDLGVWDRIEFKEATKDIVSEFQNASCFVLSSRFEGLVLVLIEAKMMGLPSICFDCPNSPREIIHEGEDGVLVEAENVEALAAALTETLKDMGKLREMGEVAREDAQKRYSPEVIKNQWIELIEK